MYSQLKKSTIFNNDVVWYFSVEKENLGNDFYCKTLDEIPKSNQYSEIRTLVYAIHSSEISKIKSLPSFVSDLPNLRSLRIPMDWLNQIEIPDTIEVLVLGSILQNIGDIHTFPETLYLNRLKYLAIPELVKPYLINILNCPNLEWIEYDLKAEKNANIISELAKLKNLKHLIFAQAKDYDVFTDFKNHEIESIELFACQGKNFPIGNIRLLKKIKYLYINNISVVFDCNLIIELPELTELSLLNLKNIVNVEKILEHENLEYLSIINCKNPFKEIGKEKFKSKGFKKLIIDYA